MHLYSFSGRRSCILYLILALIPTVSCGRYQARHELRVNDYCAQIMQRVDRRWIGNDGFFEENLLSNPDPEVREWCAIALGRIASPRALPMLYRAMHTGDAAVRAAAAFSAGVILYRQFSGEPSAISDPKAIEELRSLLNDSSSSVQARAIEALGRIGTGEDAELIRRKLQRFSFHGNVTASERAYIGFAITALGRIKDVSAMPVLDQWAKSSDPEIRRRATEALSLLEQKPETPLRIGQPAQQDAQINSFTMPQKTGLSADIADPGPVESAVTEAVARALASSRKTSTIAVIETTRGTLEVELFHEDAPLTVAEFIVTARKGGFNYTGSEDRTQQKSGFLFERIIPSGEIGGAVLKASAGFGWAMNGEANMRPFERGSLGMTVDRANPEDRQLFIALAPLPYKDGIDTCFGRVISGMPVADRIVAGDKILRVSIKSSISFLNYVKY